MDGHGDHHHGHHHQEVGVLVDDDEEELEHHARAACGGATSGVVELEQGVGDGGSGQDAATGMVFEASSSVGSVSVATMAPSQILCWPPPPSEPPQQQQLHHHHHSVGGQQSQFFLPPLPPQPAPPPPFFADFYARRALQFAYDHHHSGGGGPSTSSDPLGLGSLYNYTGHHHGGGSGMMMPPAFASSPFGDHFGRMTAQEIMDAKALAASKSHSEAERRRRERINAHLARLRSLLPNTTKTDKASLLAEVIQHVKELKRQTSEIITEEEACPLPTESDELTVDASSDEDGRLVVRASLCCADRADLLPDLIRALKALRLRALKAEITTLGGRVKNVLVITADDSCAGAAAADDDDQLQQHQQEAEAAPMSPQHTVASIQEALRAVMERTSAAAAEESGAAASSGAAAGLKRQRTTSLSAILENRSI